MKLLKFSFVLFLIFLSTSLKAQTDERNKIQMVIVNEGKTITTDLTGVGITITRIREDAAGDDNASATSEGGMYYLTLNVKKVGNDLLKVISKKRSVFNGTITITDTYGKNPPRELKFGNASLENYSDQFSSASYDDVYSAASVSLLAKEITINGVKIE